MASPRRHRPMPGLNQARFADALGRAQQVYLPGCAGHSLLFERWLQEVRDAAAKATFSGVWIPGVNRFDPCALHEGARARGIFVGPEQRRAWEAGRFDYLPLHYSEAARWFATPGRFDLVLLHITPPDAQGRCSLSLAADFTPSVWHGLSEGAMVLAHVNPRLPRTAGPWVTWSRLDAIVEAEAPVLHVADEVPETTLVAVARQVAALVRDGDTLQLGLGRLQAAVLSALSGHRGLRVHSGMVSDGLLTLRDAGALATPAGGMPPVCTGVALGSSALHAAMADTDLVRFEPVSYTHAQATLAALPRLVSINSALEIDLLGQINCETLSGEQVSGVGGLVDFARGARASDGGRAIVAVTAIVGRHARSRFVPQLSPGPVGLARTDVDLVVTEHGVADLRQASVDARAQALIRIAAPAHREALAGAWHALRRAL